MNPRPLAPEARIIPLDHWPVVERFKVLKLETIAQSPKRITGAMDSALDFGSSGSRFESWVIRNTRSYGPIG